MNPNSEQIRNDQMEHLKDAAINLDKDTIMKSMTDDMKEQLNSGDVEGLFRSMTPRLDLILETVPGLKEALTNFAGDISKAMNLVNTFIRDGKKMKDFIKVKNMHPLLLMDQEKYEIVKLWLVAIAHDHPEWDPALADEYVDMIIEFEQSHMTAHKLNCFRSLFLATGDTRWSDRVRDVAESAADISLHAALSYNSMYKQFPDTLTRLYEDDSDSDSPPSSPQIYTITRLYEDDSEFSPPRCTRLE